MLLGNHELNRGLGLPQVVHESGRIVLLPPLQPPVIVKVSPPAAGVEVLPPQGEL